MTLYFQRHPYKHLANVRGLSQFGVPYISTSVSLNVLLTLMIVIRLVLHGRSIRAAPRSAVGISGLFKTVSTMFIESCALFTMTSLVVVGALAATDTHSNLDIYYSGGFVVDIFLPILAEIQVRAFP